MHITPFVEGPYFFQNSSIYRHIQNVQGLLMGTKNLQILLSETGLVQNLPCSPVWKIRETWSKNLLIYINVTIFTTRVANKYLLYAECCVKFCKLCQLSYWINMCIRHVGGSRADAERGAGARAAAPRPVVGARRHSAAHAQAARGNYTTAIVSWYMWKEATRSWQLGDRIL